MLEVVTDNAIGLPKNIHVREIVVPAEYQTRKGTKYKARALQYCLEEGVNQLSDADWIVHLDEETLLTESSVIGIINFAHDGTAELGQGVITYARDVVVNWFTTLADSIRVGIDYGQLRFTLSFLRYPLFSWKGSFVVVRAGVEREISFDFGPEGSIAEDTFFAMAAWKNGYKFSFIQGEMWERSTFTVMDYLRQRKRWNVGIMKAWLSSAIPARQKLGITFMIVGYFCLPLCASNIVLSPVFPLPMPPILNIMIGFMSGFAYFIFAFGVVKSFDFRRIGIMKLLVLIVVMVLEIPIIFVLDSSAAFLSLFVARGKTPEFHIVKKEMETTLFHTAKLHKMQNNV